MWNPFWAFYDYFFVNHTIAEQENMRLADLALLKYYRKRFKQPKPIKV
jgi:hypothetical protein